MDLKAESCEACGKDATGVTEVEINALLTQLPQWVLVTEGRVRKLQREFAFADFVSALAFTNRVGGLAEQFNHHPALLTEWGKVTVTWWTHTLGGLHLNDFILAAKTDALL